MWLKDDVLRDPRLAGIPLMVRLNSLEDPQELKLDLEMLTDAESMLERIQPEMGERERKELISSSMAGSFFFFFLLGNGQVR